MALTKVNSILVDGAINTDANGNVGIGTSSPVSKLEVNAPNFALATTYNTLTSNFAVRTTTAQAANVGGEIALGGVNGNSTQISDFVRLHGKKENSTSTNVSGYFAVEVASDAGPAPYMFERMRIDSSGNLLVGTTSRQNATTFAVLSGGNISEFRTSVGSCDAVAFYTSGSTLAGRININGSSASYITSSDYRLKENIAPMTGALAKVSALKPCTYTWKEGGQASQGFIAHELAEVCPDAVVGEKDAVNEDGSINPQGIDTSFLVATLTAAIQEQQAIITDLKARIETLEAK